MLRRQELLTSDLPGENVGDAFTTAEGVIKVIVMMLKLFKNPSGRALNAALILTGGQVACQGLSFIRNLMLARYLTKADYGLVSAFALSIALLEIVGRMALGQQVVQARDGGNDAFQRNAQAFQLGAGVVSAILLVLASSSLARALHVPDRTWAFGLLSLIPLCMGAEHLDAYRYQREFRFLPGILCELVPQVIVTLAIWPLINWLHDFRVVLWLIIGKAVLSLGATHILAERSYRISWSQDIARRILAFSWPMLVNGLFFFAAQQADQLLIGAQYSLEQLAHYAVVASILMVLWSIFARALGPVMMTVLSGCQDRRVEFERKCRHCVEVSALATVMLTVPLVVSGEQIVTSLFGEKYVGVSRLIAFLAVASAFRFLRTGPTAAAMALGDTKNQMWSNFVRSVSLPLALIVVFMGWRIEAVAICAAIGEIAALVASFALMSVRHAIPWNALFRPFTFTAACLIGSSAISFFGAPSLSLLMAVGLAFVLACLSLAAAVWMFPELREQVQGRWVSRRLTVEASL